MECALIVEDQAPIRMALREYLRFAYPTMKIFDAADGASALALCRSQSIRLVLTDLWLPDTDGFDLIPQIKTLLPACEVIVVSMHAESAYLERARKAGAFAYVSKERINHDLLPAVARALRGTPDKK